MRSGEDLDERVGTMMIPPCPASEIDDGGHSLEWWDPENGNCRWCGEFCERCPDCHMPLVMHHDPMCSQPCGACQTRR